LTVEPATYASAGVDVAAGDRAVDLIRERAAAASRPEVLGGLGGFAGLFELDTSRWRRPVLATSTDGVGTKLAVARAMGRHDTVGVDLVAMVVDDIVVCGAEPLFLTDYIACGKLVPERIAEIVGGVADGCRLAGVALLGGETAEHPGLMAVEDYDLAGAAVGIVEADRLLGADRVRAGDAVLALASSGLHSNGFSLVRRVLLGETGPGLDARPDRLDGRSVGEVLLTPTRIYSPACLRLAEQVEVHALAHVTGGGLAANLARVLPANLDALVFRDSWTPPAVFALIAEAGPVAAPEMENTFNQGIGMFAVLPAEAAEPALALLTGCGVPSWVAGEIRPGSGQARLTGNHPA
jgi:phosphoribosylformylglycinamidine cyclo-ligase